MQTSISTLNHSFDAFLQEMLALHLHPKNGAVYWLERQSKAGANWRKEVKRVEDLYLIGPTPLEVLSTRPVFDFVPKLFHSEKSQLITTETGGATGEPRTAVFFEEEYRSLFVDTFLNAATNRGFPKGEDWLLLVPTGPHIIGKAARECARAYGSIDPFSVDFDPRFVRSMPEGSVGRKRYMEHLLNQALRVIRQQDVGVFFSTPPLLDALAGRMTDAERERVRGIHWGGMPPQGKASMNEFLTDAFPNAVGLGGFGNSLFGVAFEVFPSPPEFSHLYQYQDPRIWVEIVDQEGQLVRPGERGRLRMQRFTRSMLLINVLEKDSAVAFPEPNCSVEGRMSLGDPEQSEVSLPIRNSLY